MTVTEIEISGKIITVKPDLAECDCGNNGSGHHYSIPATVLYESHERERQMNYDFMLDICAACGDND